MKRLVITLLGVGIVGGAFALLNVDSSLEVMNPRIEQVEEEIIEDVDVIDSAKAELDRINAELDEEEQKLLQEIKAKEEQHKREIDAVKTRIEKIQETRASFQSPRGRTE